MTPKKSIEPDPDMEGATAALIRASKSAKELARQTRTAYVVMRDGKLVREIPPLIEEGNSEADQDRVQEI